MKLDSTNAQYCFLDIDINNHRQKLATAAAFVNATDTRYGFSSKDLLQLGGSEISRIQSELILNDHGTFLRSFDGMDYCCAICSVCNDLVVVWFVCRCMHPGNNCVTHRTIYGTLRL